MLAVSYTLMTIGKGGNSILMAMVGGSCILMVNVIVDNPLSMAVVGGDSILTSILMAMGWVEVS